MDLIYGRHSMIIQIVCMNSGMAKTVDKYRKHSYATMDPNQSAKDLQVHIFPLYKWSKTKPQSYEIFLNYGRRSTKTTWSSNQELRSFNIHKGTCSLNTHFEDDNAYSNYITLVESAILSRHLLGEELAEMGVNELEQLERQVDASLRQIRSTKVYIYKLTKSTSFYSILWL